MPSYMWFLGAGIAYLTPLALLVEVRRWIEFRKARPATDKAAPLRRPR